MQSPVVKFEAAVHAHATESPEKVRQALLNVIPPGLRGAAELEEQTLEGHHNNPIVRMVVRLRGREAEEAARWLASRLPPEDRSLLAAMLHARYDERTGRLYVRLSKQDAYKGELRLHDGDDVVAVVIQLRGSPSVEKAEGLLRGLGLLP